MLLPGKVQAQETTPSGAITISPSVNYIYENDYRKDITITVKNDSTEKITFNLIEKSLEAIKLGESQLQIGDSKNYLIIKSANLTLEPQTEGTVIVSVKSSVKTYDYYPALMFEIQDAAQKDKLNLNAEIYSLFILQNKTGELAIDLNTAVKKDLPFVYAKNMEFDGKIINTGQKFFDPQGSITITKAGKSVYEKQITTEIAGMLYPNKERIFSLKWQPSLSLLNRIGVYEVTTQVKPSPYEEQTTQKITVVYIPQEILISGASVLGLLIIGFLAWTFIPRKKK